MIPGPVDARANLERRPDERRYPQVHVLVLIEIWMVFDDFQGFSMTFRNLSKFRVTLIHSQEKFLNSVLWTARNIVSKHLDTLKT